MVFWMYQGDLKGNSPKMVSKVISTTRVDLFWGEMVGLAALSTQAMVEAMATAAKAVAAKAVADSGS